MTTPALIGFGLTLVILAVLLAVAIRDEVKFKGAVPANYHFGTFFGGMVLAGVVNTLGFIIGG